MVPAPCPENVFTVVATALSDGKPRVVLERLPRGGGGTRWWVVRSCEEFHRVYAELRSGGRVHLVALGGDLWLGTVGTALAEQFGSIAADVTEVVLGTALPLSLEYDVQLLDPAEALATLGHMAESSAVLYDGQVRPQPV